MLSNTATPVYYAEFRRRVESGEQPVNYKILQQMEKTSSCRTNQISRIEKKKLTWR